MIVHRALGDSAALTSHQTPSASSLMEAVSLASSSLNKLNGELQFNKDCHMKNTLKHTRLQEKTASRVKMTSQKSIEVCEKNIERCIDLWERLEKAEELAMKIKKLRKTVDRIAEKLP